MTTDHFISGYGVESSQPILRECRSLVHLKPIIDLSTLFRSSDRKEKLTIKTSFSTFHTEKGCGRDTHDAITLYRNCRVHKIIQLLPIYSLSQEVYVKHIPSELTERGEEMSFLVVFCVLCRTNRVSLKKVCTGCLGQKFHSNQMHVSSK